MGNYTKTDVWIPRTSVLFLTGSGHDCKRLIGLIKPSMRAQLIARWFITWHQEFQVRWVSTLKARYRKNPDAPSACPFDFTLDRPRACLAIYPHPRTGEGAPAARDRKFHILKQKHLLYLLYARCFYFVFVLWVLHFRVNFYYSRGNSRLFSGKNSTQNWFFPRIFDQANRNASYSWPY